MFSEYTRTTAALGLCFDSLAPHYIATAHAEMATKIKADDTPVGSLDHFTLAQLRKTISDCFPGDDIIGEEDNRSAEELTEILKSIFPQWSVDGLDGTGNHALGTNSFGGMVARRKA